MSENLSGHCIYEKGQRVYAIYQEECDGEEYTSITKNMRPKLMGGETATELSSVMQTMGQQRPTSDNLLSI